jgi:hypothetical protein
MMKKISKKNEFFSLCTLHQSASLAPMRALIRAYLCR